MRFHVRVKKFANKIHDDVMQRFCRDSELWNQNSELDKCGIKM